MQLLLALPLLEFEPADPLPRRLVGGRPLRVPLLLQHAQLQLVLLLLPLLLMALQVALRGVTGKRGCSAERSQRAGCCRKAF